MRSSDSDSGGGPGSIDIIIPTLNEAGRLKSCLRHLRCAIEDLESRRGTGLAHVWVSDGGSVDSTCRVAEAFGARVLNDGSKGRGQQLRQACEAGQGELVLMLHADAHIGMDVLTGLSDTLRSDPSISWGILGGRFDRRRFRMRVLELLNTLRFKFTGVAFGDQGIFARRTQLESVGGIPAIPLMEDVELSLRLVGTGRRYRVGNGLTVSSRRWDERPFFKSFFHVMKICVEYMIRRRRGADIHELSARMYEEYYDHAPMSAD